jgi:uncharacterized protein YdiU (UPF0061 family)
LYAETFNAGWQRAFMEKIGLTDWNEGDVELLRADVRGARRGRDGLHLFFRGLAARRTGSPSLEPLRRAFYPTSPPALESWLERYAARVREKTMEEAACSA